MSPRLPPPRPTARQIRRVAEVVGWYFGTCYRTEADLGTAAMFCNRRHLGDFAADEAALGRGEGDALFRVLVAASVFQRQRDQVVFNILRRLDAREVHSLTSLKVVNSGLDATICQHLTSTEALHEACDLAKVAGRGACTVRPEARCQLKRHTELLGRYGDFGKVPTSVALVLREAGASDLSALYALALCSGRTLRARSLWLEEAVSRVWRVSTKLAAMFLAAVSNPDLSPGLAPWSKGLDWRYFVVIDSNVSAYLTELGYRGEPSYAAQRAFLEALASKIDLRRFRRGVHAFNPRLVQQALYSFRGASNRRSNPEDCSKRAPVSCRSCPAALVAACPVRPDALVGGRRARRMVTD